MAEEIAEHIALRAEANERAGLTPEEARLAARRSFGGVEQIKERCRDERGWVWLEQLVRDFAQAARTLARARGVTIAAILTLALGLSVNATIFSFVSEVFLRPLPAVQPDRLVVLGQRIPRFQYTLPLSYPDFLDFRRQVDGDGREVPELAQAFAGIMAYKEEVVHLSRPGASTERSWIHLASNNYFSVLGAQPYLGRLFLPTEGRVAEADAVIVLTYPCWRERFGGNPNVVGQVVKLDGLSFTVIGVTAPDFVGAAWGTALSGFVPVTMAPQLATASRWLLWDRGATSCFIVGRLQPGVSLAQARAAAGLMMSRLLKQYAEYHAPAELVVWPENRSRPSPYVASYVPFILGAMMIVAGLVLAVAAANVANLLYARASDRQRELALRSALGATRRRLLRQLVLESVLLALLAGGLGMAAATAAIPLLMSVMSPTDMAPSAPTGFDWRLLAFTLLASLVTGIVTGLIPAWRATQSDVLPLLKEGAPQAGGGRHTWRGALVIGQVTISCVVLVCSGLVLRSLQRLAHLPLGFEPEHLLVASLDLDRQRCSAERGAEFARELRRLLAALPGVRRVSIAQNAPFDTTISMNGSVFAEGRPPPRPDEFDYVPCVSIDETYLDATGMALTAGRDFDARDIAARPRVAIVSAALARNLWPNETAVGRKLVVNQQPLEVVGVLREGRFWNLTSSAQKYLFVPLAQRYVGNVRVLVRTDADPAAVAGEVARVIHELDPDLPLFGVRTMQSQIGSSPSGLMPMRIGASVAGAQGAIALVLATLGVFAVVSFAVTRRMREVGIRMALGAGYADVLRLVARDGVRLVAIGLGCGLVLSCGGTWALSRVLYGTSPTDAVVFLAVPVLVLMAGGLACWLPARRAARVDPVVALRCE